MNPDISNQNFSNQYFFTVNWDYYDWGFRFNSQNILYSKTINSKDTKLIKVYQDFIEKMGKNYTNLNCEIRPQFGRLRLCLEINSTELAKDFEPIFKQIKLNNFIRKSLNFNALEQSCHYGYNSSNTNFEAFFLNIGRSLLELDLNNEYEKYSYHYLDAIRLLQNFIKQIKAKATNPDYFNLDHTFCTLMNPIFGSFVLHQDGLLPIKINFLSKCIFSGFLCNNEHQTYPKRNFTEGIYTITGMREYFILPYLPSLLNIRNTIHQKKILEMLDSISLKIPFVLLEEISSYLKDDPEQLNVFFENLTIEQLIEFVKDCSNLKDHQQN